MQTVMTSNNAYDSILLVNSNDVVLSAWIADRQLIHDYSHIPAEDWEINQWPMGFDPAQQDEEELASELLTISAYGDEIGRNGEMSDSRREFWIL